MRTLIALPDCVKILALVLAQAIPCGDPKNSEVCEVAIKEAHSDFYTTGFT